MGIVRGRPEGRGDGGLVGLWRIKVGPKMPYRILGPPEWVLIHYVDGHGSLPCDDECCPHCEAKVPGRWKAYYPSRRYTFNDGKQKAIFCVLELPEEAADLLAEITRGADLPEQFIVEIGRRSSSGSFKITLPSEQEKEPKKFPAFDVINVLMGVWGMWNVKPDKPDIVKFQQKKQA